MSITNLSATLLFVVLASSNVFCQETDLPSQRIDNSAQRVGFVGITFAHDDKLGPAWSDYVETFDANSMHATSSYIATVEIGNTKSEVQGVNLAECLIAPNSTAFAPQVNAAIGDFNLISTPDYGDYGFLQYRNYVS